MSIAVGDYVQVVEREPNPADQKSGLFYNHFRGLCGAVDRVYDDGAIGIVVDHSTLSRDMLARLKRAEKLIKPRWKSAGDTAEPEPVEAPAAAEADADAEESEESASTSPEPAAEEIDDGRPNPGLRYAIIVRAEDVRALRTPAERAAAGHAAAPPPRASEKDIFAAEQRHLQELQRRAQDQKPRP
ncbi:MAG TPA: hypothetical protein VFJ58_07880 [Armatimonadota bacterium]|nr:hypothetical protein [Armatimonadota bacterium]